jgi:hypothetical protein
VRSDEVDGCQTGIPGSEIREIGGVSDLVPDFGHDDRLCEEGEGEEMGGE